MSIVPALVGTSRPPFLILALSSMVLLLGCLVALDASFQWYQFALVCIGAITAHISVNAHNEYCDFSSGLDLKTKKTPFSGGSGTLVEPEHQSNRVTRAVHRFAWLNLVICTAIGLVFVFQSQQPLLLAAIGLIGVLTIVTYTPVLNRWPVVCLIAPGLGFGLAMVLGGGLALTHELSMLIGLSALVMAGLANNLLLVNQIPDASVDQAFGRNHWTIRFGLRSAALVYVLQWFAIVVLSVYLLLQLTDNLVYLICLLPLVLGGAVSAHLLKLDKADALSEKIMGLNVMCSVVTPITLGIGLCVVA